MRRFRGLIESYTPYRYDFALGAAILVAIVASQMLSTRLTTISWFFNAFEIQVEFDFESVESAIGIAVTLAFMVTLNVWLVFGISQFKRRIATCLVFCGLAAIGVFVGGLTDGLDQTALPNPRSPIKYASELYSGVLIQAVCVVGIVSLAAIVFQLVSKRRMSFDDQLSSQHAVTISDLFLATSLAAVTLTMLQRNQSAGAGFTTLNFVVYGALISVAGAVPPVLVAFRRIVLPIVTSVWFALLGPTISAAFNVKQSANHLVQLSAIHALAGFLVGIALMILRYRGLRFESAAATEQRSVVARRWNPRFTFSSVVALAIVYAATNSHLHIRTMVTAPWGAKYSSARAVNQLSSLLGRRPSYWGYWEVQREDGTSTHDVRFAPKERSLSIHEHPASVDFCRISLSALRDWNRIDLWLDKFSPEHGRSFHGTTIDDLMIDCKRFDADALAILCDEARIREMSIQCPSLSVRDAKTLAKHKFRRLSIHRLKVDSPDLIAALSAMRFDEISMEVVDSDLLDLTDLRCRVLSLSNSRIGKRFLERLPNNLQLDVYFRDCTFDEDVTDEVFQLLRQKTGQVSIRSPRQ
ncbi:hypothetical protein ACFL2H_10180 [Planctomycetota bacterium]